MRRTLLALATAILTAGTAAAACPGPAEMMSGGVWIATKDTQTRYEMLPGEIVAETSHFTDGTSYRVDAWRGVFLVADYDLKDGQPDVSTRTEYSYDPKDILPDPDTEGTWSGTVTVREPGKDPVEDTMSVNRGGRGTLSIGSCSYQSRTIVVTYDKADGSGWIVQLHYLPELGIAVLAASGEAGKFYSEFFRPLSISATRP